jgi:hypothetical protein
MPLTPKATPPFRSDFRCTEIVKYYLIVLQQEQNWKREPVAMCRISYSDVDANIVLQTGPVLPLIRSPLQQ